MTDTAEKHLAYCWITRAHTTLFLRRSPSTFNGGRWELPGGTVEPGEPSEQAAARETAEETGLTVRITTERSRDSWPDTAGRPLRIHARVYEAVEDGSGEVVLNPEEHDAFAWLSPGEAAELDLLDYIRKTLTVP